MSAAVAWGRRCLRCGCTRYEHIDHNHARLTNPPFPLLPRACPFGDCGEYKEPADEA